jgi:dTMP kinase
MSADLNTLAENSSFLSPHHYSGRLIAAEGLDLAWIHNLYHFAIPPDIVFYLHINPEEAVRRRLALQEQPKDVHKDDKGQKQKQNKGQVQQAAIPAKLPALTQETLESFRNFERKMYSQYQSMQKVFGFSVIEGSQSIDLIQAALRRAVMHLLLDT